jgi:dihydrofolate synthase/folylpolyglutamate synthase
MTPTLPPPSSLWEDPAEEAIAELLAHYRQGVRREDLRALERLRTALAPKGVPHAIVVVGTNGKTSTATYIARMLRGTGVRTGLYVSPHIAFWTERVQIDGEPCDGAELLSTLRAFDAVAQEQPESVRAALRFFDVLTLVVEEIFGRHGVEVGVFEAGIGGRLDASRGLAPEVVALTSVGFDHREILGETLQEILVEKLGVAPQGAVLVSSPLADPLAELARSWAGEQGVTLIEAQRSAATWPDPALPAFQRENAQLALRTCEAACERFALPVDRPGLAARAHRVDLEVNGRFHRGSIGQTPYVADTGHNVTAWERLARALAERGGRYVAVVGLTRERDPDELAEVFGRCAWIVEAIATTTRVRAGHPPGMLASAFLGMGLTVREAPAPESAFEAGLAAARGKAATLLVTGSTYLVADFLAWQGQAR